MELVGDSVQEEQGGGEVEGRGKSRSGRRFWRG